MNDNTTRLVPTQMGSDFVALNRALTWADNIEAWQSAAQSMSRFRCLEATVDRREIESELVSAASAECSVFADSYGRVWSVPARNL
jgi:hypothetical protein